MESALEAESDTILSRDELFDVLGNERRRCVIQHIISNGDAVELDALVAHVAAWENDKPVEAVTAAERKRVHTSLRQTHLPKMEEFGLVQYDERTSVVRAAEKFSDLNVYLQVVGDGIPYSLVYLVLSALSLAVLAGSWFGLPLLSLVPATVWGPLILASFGTAAVAHWYQTRRMQLVPDVDRLE